MALWVHYQRYCYLMLLSIEFNYVWIPLIALFIGFMLVVFYNLTAEKEKQMNQDLAIKHQRENDEYSM